MFIEAQVALLDRHCIASGASRVAASTANAGAVTRAERRKRPPLMPRVLQAAVARRTPRRTADPGETAELVFAIDQLERAGAARRPFDIGGGLADPLFGFSDDTAMEPGSSERSTALEGLNADLRIAQGSDFAPKPLGPMAPVFSTPYAQARAATGPSAQGLAAAATVIDPSSLVLAKIATRPDEARWSMTSAPGAAIKGAAPEHLDQPAD